MYLTYKRNIEGRSREFCCLVKAMTYASCSEGLSLALVIQHAMRVRHIVFQDLSWLYHFFPTLSHNLTTFGEGEGGVIEHKIEF